MSSWVTALDDKGVVLMQCYLGLTITALLTFVTSKGEAQCQYQTLPCSGQCCIIGHHEQQVTGGLTLYHSMQASTQPKLMQGHGRHQSIPTV